MIDNRPEAWEHRDLGLAVSRFSVSMLRSGGEWVSPSTGRSTVSRSDFSIDRRGVGATTGAVGVEFARGGVAVKARFAAIEWE